MNAINLSLFVNRIDAINGEMGVSLQELAFSPNMRDRMDYSCAVFDVSDDRVLRRRIFCGASGQHSICHAKSGGSETPVVVMAGWMIAMTV